MMVTDSPAWDRHATRSNAAAVVLSLAVVAMQLVGWYHRFWWWDVVGHTLGGAAAGALLLGYGLSRESRLALALGIALAWEVVEFSAGIYPWTPGVTAQFAYEDTALDVVVVAAGAYLISEAWEQVHR